MASLFVLELQTLVSREIPTGKQAVATVGAINGGTAHNVIPGEVELKLTLRSYEDEVRKKLLSGVARIAQGIAVGRGVPADRMPIVEHVKSESIDANYNNPELTERLVDLWQRELGDVRLTEQRMGGEDFSLYTGPNREIPTMFARIGATDPKVIEECERRGVPVPTTHQSNFAPMAAPTISGGVTAMVTAATSLLKKRPSEDDAIG
jgi:hippurate hydrolase